MEPTLGTGEIGVSVTRLEKQKQGTKHRRNRTRDIRRWHRGWAWRFEGGNQFG